MNYNTPSVNYYSPSVNYDSPVSVNYDSPASVNYNSPASVNYKSPKVTYNAPAEVTYNRPVKRFKVRKYKPDPYNPEYTPTLYRWDDSKDEKVKDISSRQDHQWYRGDYQDEFRETHDYYSLDVVPPSQAYPQYE